MCASNSTLFPGQSQVLSWDKLKFAEYTVATCCVASSLHCTIPTFAARHSPFDLNSRVKLFLLLIECTRVADGELRLFPFIGTIRKSFAGLCVQLPPLVTTCGLLLQKSWCTCLRFGGPLECDKRVVCPAVVVGKVIRCCMSFHQSQKWMKKIRRVIKSEREHAPNEKALMN